MTFDYWKRLTEWPLAAAAVVFLGAYAWTVIVKADAVASVIAELVMTIV